MGAGCEGIGASELPILTPGELVIVVYLLLKLGQRCVSLT